MTDATSLLVYPGPTRTHRVPCYVNVSPSGRYATLLGWAETEEIANQAAFTFENSEPISTEELFGE